MADNEIFITTGGSNNQIGVTGDNSQYFSEEAKKSAEQAKQSATEAHGYAEQAKTTKNELLNDSDFVAVRNTLDEIVIVSENLSVIEETSANIAAIKTTAENKTEIDTVVANLPTLENTVTNLSDITTVSTNINAVKTTSSNINNINTTANNIGTIQTAVTNLSTINTVSSNLTPIKNTANNITAINNVNTNIEAVKSNYTNISDIKANATNMADIKDTAKLVTTLDEKVDIDDMVQVDFADASSYISGCPMPSGTTVTLTVGSSGATYTAPANGWFYAGQQNSSSNKSLFLINNSASGLTFGLSIASCGKYFILPAKKGDEVVVNYDGAVSSVTFTYAEGEVAE